MDVVVKWLGSVYDVCVFVNLDLNKYLKSGKILLVKSVVVDNIDVIFVFFLGDLVYLLMLYVMKEYVNGGVIV